MEEFSCYVCKTVFYSIETDFGIYDVFTNDKISGFNSIQIDFDSQLNVYYTTILGNIGQLEQGIKYKVKGVCQENAKFNKKQYNVKRISPIKPYSKEEQVKFLKSIVSENIADNIIKECPNFLELIIKNKENEIDLSKIKGVGKTRLTTIKNKISRTFDNRELITLLSPYNLSANMVKRISGLSANTEELVKQIKANPYILTKINGISFKKADNIALKMNPSLEVSYLRTNAFIKQLLLDTSTKEGHTYLLTKYVYKECMEYMSENKEFLLEILRSQPNEYHFQIINGQKTIGLKSLFDSEKNIANQISLLKKSENTFKQDIDYINQKNIEIENKQGFEFTDEQKSGIISILQNNVSFVMGYAGTGKSSITNAVLSILEENKYNIAQCCISGKASLRLKELNGINSFTIHRLLGLGIEDITRFNQDNPLPYDVLLIDEASMIGLSLFNMLLMACKVGTKLIIIGDSRQLDAIGTGCVFKDLLESNQFNLIHLTKVHRQAQKSGILTDSIKIRNNKFIKPITYIGVEQRGEIKDFILNVYENKEDTLKHIIQQFNSLYKKYDINDIQIIVPMKINGSASVYTTNNAIQHIANPIDKNKQSVNLQVDKKPFVIQIGDKIRNTKNIYKVIELEKTENNDYKTIGRTALFNGNLGIVLGFKTIDEEKCMIVDYEGIGILAVPESHYKYNTLLGYAITCHAFQGSQSKAVIIGMDTSSYILLSSGWLYTAITRAIEKCFLNCNPKALYHATKTNKVVMKQTYLPTILNELKDKKEK